MKKFFRYKSGKNIAFGRRTSLRKCGLKQLKIKEKDCDDKKEEWNFLQSILLFLYIYNIVLVLITFVMFNLLLNNF